MAQEKVKVYLKKDKNFFVVERANEAIGKTIKSIAREIITIKDKVIWSRIRKHIEDNIIG